MTDSHHSFARFIFEGVIALELATCMREHFATVTETSARGFRHGIRSADAPVPGRADSGRMTAAEKREAEAAKRARQITAPLESIQDGPRFDAAAAMQRAILRAALAPPPA
jgi:hypothetical protein